MGCSGHDCAKSTLFQIFLLSNLMVFPSGDLIQFVEKIWESLYDSLLILSSPHTNRSLLYILEFGFFSQTLYCISIFVNNRDQGFATFLTLNTTCMRK
jgi:hypothetical protein